MTENLHNNKTVFFRCDASFRIGSGHVTRCLALAKMMQEKGWTCSFLTISDSMEVVPALKESGFALLEPDQTPQAADLLIVDHYELDQSYESPCRVWAKKILVMDDIGGRAHDCDFLLDQTALDQKDIDQHNIPKNAHVFGGIEYAILRPDFLELQKEAKIRNAQPKRVLLFFGSTDVADLTQRILRFFKKMETCLDHCDVVIGDANPHRAGIEALCQALENTKLHIQTPNMARLMLDADMAIGCGGTAIWERLALKLPTLEIAHTIFQCPCLEKLHAKNYVDFMGMHDALSDNEIEAKLHQAFQSGLGLNLEKIAVGAGIDTMIDQLEGACAL